MDAEKFREAMSAAKREDRLLWVADDDHVGIAVGCDSARGVIILHRGKEIPMAGAREIKPLVSFP